jgi:hypothetical protein
VGDKSAGGLLPGTCGDESADAVAESADDAHESTRRWKICHRRRVEEDCGDDVNAGKKSAGRKSGAALPGAMRCGEEDWCGSTAASVA